MTRECKKDFERIQGYVGKYSIEQNLDNSDYIASLKRMHKCYFSLITWNAELLHRKEGFASLEPSSSEDIILRLAEVVSDSGTSLFNWMNGNYKASRVMLRVSIENFVRAISAFEDKSQLLEKNVHQLFERASKQEVFRKEGNIRKCYESLHSDYKTLCEDAHTASVHNMEHLTSLSDLPAYEKEKSGSSAEIYVRICRNITAIFCIRFNSFYHQMHHRNRENILNSLSSEIKSIVTAPP
ncbi:hypothetical protein [uncultured Pseudoteredinibacter sp.]|uniref:hypothetical protein n=1 Tax=uncultured Pseudoteredinibacter sp. TaxID=1641701 RepID=UPI002620F74D|nr:hypothetical protein [uncultured Pseudoteredinibacter sp.]